MIGIPLEPFSLLVGTLVGAWKEIAKARVDQMTAALNLKKEDNADTADARKMSKGNKELQWTKRVLALITVVPWAMMHLGINVPELLGINAHVVIGYTEMVPKFLFFGEKEAFKWVTVDAPALTPAYSNMVAFIMGYYFGSGGTRASK